MVRHYLLNDPRPDLCDDHESWEDLLYCAWRTTGDGPDGLAVPLYVLREGGARLFERGPGLVLRPGDELDEADYQFVRENYLMPHSRRLHAFLGRRQSHDLISDDDLVLPAAKPCPKPEPKLRQGVLL